MLTSSEEICFNLSERLIVGTRQGKRCCWRQNNRFSIFVRVESKILLTSWLNPGWLIMSPSWGSSGVQERTDAEETVVI